MEAEQDAQYDKALFDALDMGDFVSAQAIREAICRKVAGLVWFED